jgi:hypothetical protein
VTSPAPILPVDDEALVCGWLAARSELSGVIVADRLPVADPDTGQIAYNGTQLVVTVTRIGGGMDRAGGGQWLDRPRWDLSCHGPTKAAAKDLTAIIRSLLAVARFDDHAGTGAVWCDTTEDVGPQWLPDPDYPEAGRYLLQVSGLIHPTIH